MAVQKIKSTTPTNPEQHTSVGLPSRYLITMKSYWHTQQVYKTRLKNLKNENIFISEDLTIAESRLFFKTRQLKKAGKIHTTWTSEGKVFIRLSPDQDAIEIHENDDILRDLSSRSTTQQHQVSQITSDDQNNEKGKEHEEIQQKEEPSSLSKQELTSEKVLQAGYKDTEGIMTRAAGKKIRDIQIEDSKETQC